MEVLKRKLYNMQHELEDDFLMEVTHKEAKATTEGRKLLRFLKRRRRVMSNVLNALERIG